MLTEDENWNEECLAGLMMPKPPSGRLNKSRSTSSQVNYLLQDNK